MYVEKCALCVHSVCGRPQSMLIQKGRPSMFAKLEQPYHSLNVQCAHAYETLSISGSKKYTLLTAALVTQGGRSAVQNIT